MYSSFGAVWKNGSRQAKFFTWQTLSFRTAAPAVLAVAPTATAVTRAQTTAMVRLMCPPAQWRNQRRPATPEPVARWSVGGRAHRARPASRATGAAARAAQALPSRADRRRSPPGSPALLRRLTAGAADRAHASSFLAGLAGF